VLGGCTGSVPRTCFHEHFTKVDESVVRVRAVAKDGKSQGNLPPTQRLGEDVQGQRLSPRLGLGALPLGERTEHADGVRITCCRTLRYLPRDVDQIIENGAQVRGFAGVFDLVCGADRRTNTASGAEGRRFESCVARLVFRG